MRSTLWTGLPFGVLLAVTPPVLAADAANPTVVELFQSQGCSSCPPADLVLNQLAGRPGILALNFAVTYWDQLGWKDSFGQQAFTARQWAYARAGHRANVATPQMIVNGVGVINGGRLAEAEAAIARYDRRGTGPVLTATRGKVSLAGAHAAGTTLWLVRYDPRTIDVAIGAGENSGRVLPHRNIVRSLTALGTVKGASASFALPARTAAYREAVLVQAGSGGPIVAARAL